MSSMLYVLFFFFTGSSQPTFYKTSALTSEHRALLSQLFKASSSVIVIGTVNVFTLCLF